MPDGQVPSSIIVAFPEAPSTAGEPFTVSLAATFAMAVDALPAGTLPDSGVAMITPVIVTVSIADPQSGGEFRSHN
jgi:hypothetical protein